MIQIISGEKGKGKTKILLDKVNAEINGAKGNIVYLDKSTKHMHELSNKVRLINVRDYCIENSNEFLGFMCGIISQDYDLQTVYLDSFLSITCLKDGELEHVVDKLETISAKFNVNIVISISVNEEDFPENVKKLVIVSL